MNAASQPRFDAESHHYLPKVYLRQWCIDDLLFRYRRVGPSKKLVADHRSPEHIACEPGLNSIPLGMRVNDLSENDVEKLLGREVDEKIGVLTRSAMAFTGHVDDEQLASDLRWLMSTFVARDPARLAQAEKGADELVVEEGSNIRRLARRAQTEKYRTKLTAFLDPRFPSGVVRKHLAAFATGDAFHRTEFASGELYVVHADRVRAGLAVLGLKSFLTFKDPVVGWRANDIGVLSSFSLSPQLLLVHTVQGVSLSDEAVLSTVVRHAILQLRYREFAIVNREVDKDSHVGRALAELPPWTGE